MGCRGGRQLYAKCNNGHNIDDDMTLDGTGTRKETPIFSAQEITKRAVIWAQSQCNCECKISRWKWRLCTSTASNEKCYNARRKMPQRDGHHRWMLSNMQNGHLKRVFNNIYMLNNARAHTKTGKCFWCGIHYYEFSNLAFAPFLCACRCRRDRSL